MKARMIIGGATALAVAAVLFMAGKARSTGAGAAQDGAPGDTADEGAAVYSVMTQQAALGSLRPYLELTGDVVAETSVEIFPEIGGKLATVRVKVGDGVVKSQTLIAEVDPSRPGASYSLSPVYSPISGTITAMTAQQGATISASAPLGTVGVLGYLAVDAQVPETMVAGLRVGQRAELSFSAYPGRAFAAELRQLSPVLDPSSRTKRIRLGFSEGGAGIEAGMFARIKLFSDPRPRCVLVPEYAVLSRPGRRVAFVSGGGAARLREVVVGQASDGIVEILSGLIAGESVVVKGQELLDDGTSIRVVESAAEAKR